eukprot:COSAG04_NODE_24429_length_322_cov_0.690583_1_plen_69_part_10
MRRAWGLRARETYGSPFPLTATGVFGEESERQDRTGPGPQICPPAYAPAKGQGLLRYPLRAACAPVLQP